MSIRTVGTAAPAGHAATATVGARALPAALAMILGMLVIGMVGFSHVEAVHNAAHDYRHSMGYPCH